MNYLIITLLTVVKIAAFNSSDEAKLAADVVCTGNHDEKTIQTILDRFDSNNEETCTLIFADGTYHIDGFHTPWSSGKPRTLLSSLFFLLAK